MSQPPGGTPVPGYGLPPPQGQPPSQGPPAPHYAPPTYGHMPMSDEDRLAGAIVPINVQNKHALIASWLGIGSLLCFGPILGIPAVIFGVMALKRPELGGGGRAWAGIVLGGLTSVGYGFFYIVSALG